jgi:predicted permease
MHALLQDFRFSLRQLRKSPGFAITAIITLALGVGANVVVFSVLNGLILRPLNVPDAKSLYNISRKPYGWDSQSYPDYIDYRDRNNTFSGIAAYKFEQVGITLQVPGSQQETAIQSLGFMVSGNYFDLLGVKPALGRFLHASDEHGPNSAPYAVLSYAFWHNHLSSDPHVIGRVLYFDKHPFTVIGVASRGFHGTELLMWPDYWLPIVDETQLDDFDFLNLRGTHTLYMLGRIKPGVNRQQGSDNLNAIAAQLAKMYPEDDRLDAKLVKPGLLGDELGTPARSFLLGIMLMALLVLLAACANLASIFAARAADRSRELAIRMAIGSGRWHIVRQLLAESIIISFVGGAIGTILASSLLQALSQWQPMVEVPLHVVVDPDATVYAVALLLSLASGIFFGLLPVRQIWQIEAAQAMKSGPTAMTPFRRLALRDILLTLQIAICTLLVTASFVALRGMVNSLHANMGFHPQNATILDTDLTLAGYSDDQALLLQKRLVEQATQIPGILSAGVIDTLPLGVSSNDSRVYRKDTVDFRPSNGVLDAMRYTISPGYMQTAETHLLAGRDFTWADDDKAPRVAIVNATFARIMFGNQSAIGQHFRLGHDSHTDLFEIVGVAEDGKYRTLTEEKLPAMYFSIGQDHTTGTVLVVRSQILRPNVAQSLQHLIAGIDPSLPYSIHAWSDSLEFALFPSRAATAALGVMGLFAAMLAVTGIFGMAAYSVSKRMKELGIRVALGAQPMRLIRDALARPVFLLLIGSIGGLGLGMMTSNILAHIVYQATPRDPLVMLSVVLTMTLLGALATWVPARRAQSVDPARLLRED